ncbi:MAG: hypothetical protein B7Y39_18605 [Bdellovibrio sp. 28-41-41]|nr:MAG: hypothetical protein B7Y39_18605 [Bdellovibrio sp. 28-41-41]
MNSTNEFVIKDLVKFYNKNKVLDVGEMNLKPGQFVALMGKNGSGKSTIMRLLAQQELYNSGDILYGGTSLRSTKIKLNPQTVFISEDQELPFSVPLTYWLDIQKKMYPGFDEGVFQRLIRSFEIDISKTFHSLSRGQRIKALFCLEAPKRPNIYLLDEVTSVLDQGSRWTLMQFLKEEIDRGCLVVMSTNIASEMQGFATDVVFLEKGRVNFISRSSSLNQHFRKIRVSKDQEELVQKTLGAKRIGFNHDNTWTFLLLRDSDAKLPIGINDDLREITISDVQSYFTAREVDL